MSSQAALAAVHLRKRYGGVVAVDDVSLELRRGEVTAIVGENGAGKSTVTGMLAGVVTPDAGQILVAGNEVRFHRPEDALRSGIAVVYQELSLLPAMPVVDNLYPNSQPTRGRLIDRNEARRRARSALDRVGAADIDPDSPVEELSIARRQLVEIARALEEQPDVIIFDEPTSSLGSEDAERLLDIIRGLAADGVAVGYISHRLDELFAIADRFVVLRDGSTVWSRPSQEVDTAVLLRAMVGRDVDDTYPEPAAIESGASVRLRVASVDLPGSGPDGLNFEVRAGEVLGIAGLVGSGRSRIARLLSGVEPMKHQGTIEIDGAPVRGTGVSAAIGAGLMLVPEDRKLHGIVLDLDLVSNIVLPSIDDHQRLGVMNRNAELATAAAGLQQLDVRTSSAYATGGELSGGNQQKVVLAKWLAKAPAVLVLDEPTRGIDVNARAEIYRVFQALSDSGIAIVLISSDLPEVLGLSHRVIVMRDGAIAGEFEAPFIPDEVMAAAALGTGDSAAAGIGTAHRNGETGTDD